MPKTLLIKNARVLVTMDSERREIAGGGLYCVDNRIEAVGPTETLPAGADTVLDLTDHVVMPGLVNTHHHMFQTLTRATPAGQDAELFGWLQAHYRIWANITPEMVGVAATTAMAELILSGCTTASDHHYLYTNGIRLEDSIEAAAAIGLRFYAARGAMTLGESSGGLPPDRVVETEATVLTDMRRLVEAYHDASRFSMLRIVLAPCSPFSVTDDLMRESARLARHYGVSLHTHLAENDNDIAYSLARYGKDPADYVRDLDWVGPDVWHAHCVKLDAKGIALFARTGTGVAHCPCSNMRLASGIAPVRRMIAEGVKVGLGVDGSASNDAGHLLAEARQALLLARVAEGPGAMSARQALEIATLGGARVLNRDDIGALAPGMAADVVAFDMRAFDYTGAQADPVAALLFCTPRQVAWSIINGRIIVADGQLTTLDLARHTLRHNGLARALYAMA
ncbi:MAG: 8-oxoguanine deaminase [Labrys sp. (in: a-proteobacteria)]